MVSDLELELFASEFLGTYLYKSSFLLLDPGLSTFPKEYYLDSAKADICEESYTLVVFVKLLFYNLIFDELLEQDTEFEPSPSYISDYISRTCRRDGLFGDQTIFELLFTSLAFVIHLIHYCIVKFGYEDVLCYAHVSWAMYFDEYKGEFYSKGGWSQLKIVSRSYVLPHEFLLPYPEAIFPAEEDRRDYILHVMNAVDNYKTFASRINANFKTVSKAWVKYNLQNFSKCEDSIVTIDTAKSQDIEDPKVIENFLLDLRRLCDPNTSEVLDVKAQPKLIDSCRQYTEEIPQSLLKLSNLTLNDKSANTVNNGVKQREIEVPLQESEDQTNQLSGIYLSESNDIASNTSENDASRNASFFKQKMTSNDDFPRMDKKQDTSKQKTTEETKREIDLERESPEVKCLSRMLLVLGKPDGMMRVRASFLSLEPNEQKELK
ncbi:hypothetical protein TNIN_361611 [Trichonephila inaurata madagascariensis]|uniref:Uncharacterized protein n=1 Tax=Trichonephila inaurata madagascariensis TaxID=2747483 RepID=A0A8X7BZ46_9ARAC|nr:hypothetical protein TNIN_361611 [Trichonephila inaurata madagascariensis]